MTSHQPMSEEELERIQLLCDRATKGPWEASIEGRDHWGGSNIVLTAEGDLDIGGPHADLDFIASARQDVVQLLGEVRRLRSDSAQAPDPVVRQPMTEEELSLIQRVSVAATAGPWTVSIEERGPSGSRIVRTTGEDLDIFGATDADLDFIANAREDVPRLLEEVRALRPPRSQDASAVQPSPAPSNLGWRWIALGEALGFRVISPYRVEFGPRRALQVDAFIPGFGAPRGTLLVTDLEVVRESLNRMYASGFLVATLGDPGTNDLSDEDLRRPIDDANLASAILMLRDWGWNGAASEMPEWLRTEDP